MKRKRTAALLWAIGVMSCLPAAACVVLPEPRGNMPDSGSLPLQGDTSASPAHYAAFIATTDYSLAGGFAAIDLDTRQAYLPDEIFASRVVSPDPVATAHGDHVFIINRFTYDNISVLDKNFQLTAQYSVADASCDPSNPHDLAFVSESKAYLTRYECPDLWIINPLTGQRLGSIDLAAAGYGGVDGIPEMSGMLLHGATLFVAVQNLDRKTWQPTVQSYLVMIDTATDAVIGGLALLATNPATDVVYEPSLDRVLVGEQGLVWAVGDGGIESINPDTGVSEGWIATETDLGGNIADFAILDAGRGYAAITDAAFQSSLVGFDPATGIRDPGVIYSAEFGFTLWDMAMNDRGEIYICDRSATDPGIVVIDALAGDAIVTPGPIDVWLPPFSIVFLQ